MVLLFELCRWDVADRLEQAPVVEPVDPFERRELDVIEVLPQLGRTQRQPGVSCSPSPLRGDSRGMTTEPQMEYLDALAHLRTPDESPWTDRRHKVESEADSRSAFECDRDRLIHSEHRRRLQHKTQVLIVTESDLCSTRLLRPVQTAQVGRSLACSLGLNGAFAEAIVPGARRRLHSLRPPGRGDPEQAVRGAWGLGFKFTQSGFERE